MAITKTTRVQRAEVYPKTSAEAEATESAAWPTVMAVYEDACNCNSCKTFTKVYGYTWYR